MEPPLNKMRRREGQTGVASAVSTGGEKNYHDHYLYYLYYLPAFTEGECLGTYWGEECG